MLTSPLPASGVIGKKVPISPQYYRKMVTYLPLFNPRTQNWSDHFYVEEGVILGKTDIAKGTIRLLDLNTTELILERKELMEAGYF